MGLFRTNPQIEDSLRYNTFQASDKTLNRVTENITNNLADSYHDGLGIRDAGRRINKEFAGLKGWESRRIARTEINSAQNEGAFSAYDELGVEYHMWWTGRMIVLGILIDLCMFILWLWETLSAMDYYILETNQGQ